MRTTIRQLHDGWTFRQVDPSPLPNTDLSSWLPAVVPGHVHLDLMRLGLIPDPFERMHERTVQWVDDCDWVYRSTFVITADEHDGARHILRFDGLDTIAAISLNGAVVATTDNMFVEHEIDVTEVLRIGANELEVQLASAERTGAERLAASSQREEIWHAGDRHAHRGLTARSMVRKAQYHWGWDWGPRLRGCGIWKDVSLARVPVARITSWSWRVRFEDDGSATVAVDASVEGDATIDVRVHGHGVDVSGPTSVRIEDPQRWWCAGLGEQPLYDLTISARADGEVVDEVAARIGLREVELVREADEAGESFSFRINGEDFFAKGANWIPDDTFPARSSRDRIFELVRLARDCGMNMLRIWGGGMYESTDFYEACDELGILVWQDFTYACAQYPDDDAAVGAAVDEATRAVRRLRNHTSLALWCGNNENQWLSELGFLGGHGPLLGGRIYHEALPAVVAAEDPDRPYWPSSPWSDAGHPNDEGSGDRHNWDVWHGFGDWRGYTRCTSRFVSEFGFAGPPDRRTLEEVLLPSDLGADTPAMRWHDKTNKGYETYLGYIALHYPMPETYDDLVYYGQLNQAAALRYGIEHYRRQMPHTMGTLAWQLNDCWPVQSWAWIDSALRPKAVWYAARRFYAPLLLSLWQLEGDRVVNVSLVNDHSGQRRAGRLDLRGFAADGAVVFTEAVDVGIDPGSSALVHTATLPREVVLVHAALDGVESTHLLVEPKDLVLEPADIRVDIDAGADGRSSITVVADGLALSLLLWLDGADARWSDNLVDLLPGEPRTIEVETSSGVPVADRLRWRSLSTR